MIFIETQYRVVGHNGASSHISWYDTIREAMQHASSFERASVYRPDGSYIATLYRR